MQLPNYFLADLPSEAALTNAMLTEAGQTLKRNRAQYLLPRSTGEIIRLIDEVARQWRKAEYHLRRLALARGPGELCFSRPTLERGLDSFFSTLKGEDLENLVASELGHRHRLDHPVSSRLETEYEKAAIARGPELLVHIVAGNIPNPALSGLVLGLLVRSAQFVKCASGASLLPRLFAHSIYEHDPKLGACLEVAEWPGGNESLEAAIFAEADCVTVTGSDATLASVRNRLPIETRFIGYGHRVSFAHVTREALARADVPRLVEKAATDVVAWNQLGCLSPHLFYVEADGRVSPEVFAEMLAQALAEREKSEPRGRLPTEVGAQIATRRAWYEVRAAHLPKTQIWCSENSTAWTVVFEADPAFQLSCLHRFVLVKSVSSLEEALHAAEAVRGGVSTVGLAAAPGEQAECVRRLAHWGVTRICPLGRMQTPPLTWRHDGRLALADLITWTDWET